MTFFDYPPLHDNILSCTHQYLRNSNETTDELGFVFESLHALKSSSFSPRLLEIHPQLRFFSVNEELLSEITSRSQ